MSVADAEALTANDEARRLGPAGARVFLFWRVGP